MDDQKIKSEVRSRYAGIALQGASGCCSGGSGCCGETQALETKTIRSDSGEDAAIAAADLGLSCGLPTQYAQIRPGDTVLDLGSGAGVDVFRAAKEVGPAGLVIGVDMTPEMISRARRNAANSGAANVDFRLGEIEALPVDRESIDVVLSNCVLNLVPDKRRAFQEIYRVLKPGGRFSISDIVTYGEMPAEIRQDMELWAGCVAGAIDREAYLDLIRASGFTDLHVDQFIEYDKSQNQGYGLASMTVEARKG